MAEKDYIIFDQVPVINFNSEVPFRCEANYSNAASWYSAQSRTTKKPRPKVFGTISTNNCASNFDLQNISANISVHGNYTAYYRQKSLKLHLDEAQNLFGLNKGATAKDWILLADYGDNSKLRNALSLYMGQQFFRGPWAATFTFVQVYIDNIYYGLFLLTDAKKVEASRININKPAEGYTGVDIGYLFERDDYLTYDHKDPGFIITYPDEYLPKPLAPISHGTNISYGVDATYKDEYSISSDIYDQNQIDFLKKFTCLVYTIMYEACINNQYYEINSTDIANWQNWALVQSQLTNPVEVVSKVIDLNSFVDMYLLQEIAADPDLAHSSWYMCVDMSAEGSKKLTCCCPWDFDRGYGISNGLTNAASNELWARGAHYNPWVSLLPQAKWFITLLKTRYNELKSNDIFAKCSNMLDDYADNYINAFAQNYTKYSIRWEGDAGGWINNGSPAVIASLNAEYYQQINTEKEAEVLLKSWFDTRVAALDIAIDKALEDTKPSTGGTKDYIIFNNAPTITFTCNEPIYDWYMSMNRLSEKTRITGTISTSDCKDEFILDSVAAEIRVRGNYTADYSKKPFQIRFSDKQNLFGLNNGNSHKKWVLLTEYTDGSMLRNATSLYLAQQIYKNTNIWVPTFTFAHFYIQDSTQCYYMGLYLLIDQKEQAKKRVNVFEPEDGYAGTDIGYFFERDDYFQTETDPTFSLARSDYRAVYPTSYPASTSHESNAWGRQAGGGGWLTVDGYTISSTITDPAQVDFLKAHLLKVYTILWNASRYPWYEGTKLYELDENYNLVVSSETDPETCVRKAINLESFVDRYILEELTCNPDLPHSSFYLSLDMSESGDKKLTLCCPWDYDRAFGSTNRFANNPETAGLWAKQCTLNPWINLLAQTDWFKALVDQRWQELYDNYVFSKTLKMQNAYSTKYVTDFAKNYTEWSIHYSTNATWNVYDSQGRLAVPNDIILYPAADTEAEHKEIVSSWLNSRFITLHSLFNGQGSTDWPEEPIEYPIPPGKGNYLCVIDDDGNYALRKIQIFGAGNIRKGIKNTLGNNVTNQNIEQIIYSLQKQEFITNFRLDLETGGQYLSEFDGYKNWFPGALTYGFLREIDATIYNRQLVDGEYKYIPTDKYVPHWGQGQDRADSTIQILEVLDNIDMNLDLRSRLQLMWHIKTADGTTGYINATAVSDVFYKAKIS